MSADISDDFDSAHRELCPDGNCTGVLDDGGICKVCGARGTPPAPRSPDTVGEAVVAAESAGAAEAVAAVVSSGEGDELDDDRQLCPDGSCVGLIGPDGRCKVCGTSVAPASPAP